MADIQETATKKCTKCKELKPLEYFHRNKNNKDGRMHVCSSCRSIYKKNRYLIPALREKELKRKKIYYYETNQRLKQKKYLLQKKYGLTIAQKVQMLELQNYKCVGCNCPISEENSKVDHCHITKKVRGILCNNCNLALGLVYDNISTLKNLIEYLKRSNNE